MMSRRRTSRRGARAMPVRYGQVRAAGALRQLRRPRGEAPVMNDSFMPAVDLHARSLRLN
jgi:hypothetical protein